MLVISRRVGEAVHIGNDVVLRVTRLDHDGNVRLAIDAPREVRILREELVLRNRREERERDLEGGVQ